MKKAPLSGETSVVILPIYGAGFNLFLVLGQADQEHVVILPIYGAGFNTSGFPFISAIIVVILPIYGAGFND